MATPEFLIWFGANMMATTHPEWWQYQGLWTVKERLFAHWITSYAQRDGEQNHSHTRLAMISMCVLDGSLTDSFVAWMIQQGWQVQQSQQPGYRSVCLDTNCGEYMAWRMLNL